MYFLHEVFRDKKHYLNVTKTHKTTLFRIILRGNNRIADLILGDQYSFLRHIFSNITHSTHK